MYELEGMEVEEYEELNRLALKKRRFDGYVEFIKKEGDIWDILQLCENSETYTDLDEGFPFFLVEKIFRYEKFNNFGNYVDFTMEHPEVFGDKPLITFDMETEEVKTYSEEEAWEYMCEGNRLSEMLMYALPLRYEIFPLTLNLLTEKYEKAIEEVEGYEG